MNIGAYVLAHHQVRKSKKQKQAFKVFLENYAAEHGYPCKEERGLFGVRNLVVGDPDSARVVYTAHYDTCPVLPFPNFITPKRIGWYLLYQLLLTGVILAAMAVIGLLAGVVLTVLDELLGLGGVLKGVAVATVFGVIYFGTLLLLLAGPANRHTANDNTSGVVTLLEIMSKLPAEARSSVAFVFFDLEEAGMLGSLGFVQHHKGVRSNTLLLNFDCVSDGDRILLALRRGAERDLPRLQRCFKSENGFQVELLSKGVFYPSDQLMFNRGVGVAALKHSRLLKTDYMDRIHTNRDVIFQEKNMEFLANCAVQLACEMTQD